MGGYERRMTSWCTREHCIFLTVDHFPLLQECVVELCEVQVLVYCHFLYISRMCISHLWYTHGYIYTLNITGWMDRIDGGIT